MSTEPAAAHGFTVEDAESGDGLGAVIRDGMFHGAVSMKGFGTGPLAPWPVKTSPFEDDQHFFGSGMGPQGPWSFSIRPSAPFSQILRETREEYARNSGDAVSEAFLKAEPTAAADLTGAGQQRFAALCEWRIRIAREHNLPAFVIFHDATLKAIAALDPKSVWDLEGVSGVSAMKLEKYGPGLLEALQAVA